MTVPQHRPPTKPETRANPALFPSPEVRARCEVIRDLGPANARYSRVWDEIKAAR